jgi:hypothetical protein
VSEFAPSSPEWEAVGLEFIACYEAGENPTLEDFIAQYPQFAEELTDFVTDFLHIENADKREGEQESDSNRVQEAVATYRANNEAVTVWTRTLKDLEMDVHTSSDEAIPP